MSLQPTSCTIAHPAFALLEGPVFRLSEGDRLPALALELDGAAAILPLPAMARAFGMEPDSPDGRMLQLVADSLRFVVSLRPGDKLPTEVLTGEPSWQPSPFHRQAALTRLQLRLVAQLRPPRAPAVTAAMLGKNHPAAAAQLAEALRGTAAALGVEGGPPAVAALLNRLADETAFIEALRERLLDRVSALQARLSRLGRDRLPATRREILGQVVRLTAKGVADLAARFAEADEHTAAIHPALRDVDGRLAALRPARDWLYSTQLAWEPELRDWDRVPGQEVDDTVWRLIDRLYRLVAPRYMDVQEWLKADDELRAVHAKATLTW